MATITNQQLSNNPIFQLSLSSKELYHSNFLYWMAIDTQLPRSFFPDLMNEAFNCSLFLNDPQWDSKYEFSREYENFDFCIRNKNGEVVFLLENKFKSLPREDQLEEYTQKVSQINKNTKPVQVLLTLAQPIFTKSNIWCPSKHTIQWSWQIVRYSDYASAIQRVLGKYIKDFRMTLIEQYKDYIEIFSTNVENALFRNPGITYNTKYIDAFNSNPFPHNYRVDDIWQKLVADQIDLMIVSTIQKKLPNVCVWSNDDDMNTDINNGKKGVRHGSGYTNSTGLVSYMVPIIVNKQYSYAFTIQIQNGQYRRCLELRNRKQPSSSLLEDDLLSIVNWLNPYFRYPKNKSIVQNPPALIKSGAVNPVIKIGSKPGTAHSRGFCKYGNEFVYQYWAINGEIINDIVQQVCDDLTSILPHI